MAQPIDLLHEGTDREPHSLIATMKGPRNPQDECVLFVTIFPEIRNFIFSLALQDYDDVQRPYPETAHFSRPGYRFHRRIDTALLVTCRQVYAETYNLPVSQNEHVFWCKAYRGPPRAFCDQPGKYFNRFTQEQKAAVKYVHFFSQLTWLEDGAFQKFCQLPNLHLKHLKITVRHTDWWWWETNQPLAIKSHWVDKLNCIDGLESVEIELETMERDKDQLETIMKSMLKWPLSFSGSTVTAEENSIKKQRYLGQSRFSDRYGRIMIFYYTESNQWSDDHSIKVFNYPDPKLAYVVVNLLWTKG